MRTYRPHPDVTVLHDQVEVPGLGFLPINAFVLHAEQPLVVDTGLGLPDRDFVGRVAEVIEPSDVRWIWLTHPDRDHTGGIFALLEAAPEATVVTTFMGAGIMGAERPLPMERVFLLNPGQSLDLGDRTVTGFKPPLWDNPATVGILDTKTGVAFSSDCFGGPLATSELAAADDIAEVDPEQLRGAQMLWASADSPWVHFVDPARFATGFEPLRAFGASHVFSTHLPPAAGDPTRLLDTAFSAANIDPYVGPDQAALEAMLQQFEPA